MRATSDLLRRRRPLTRKRAEWLAHIHQTNSPYNRPEIGTQLADKANRDGGAERFPASAVQTSIDWDLTRRAADDRLLTDRERDLVRTATAHEAQPVYRRRSIPGVGQSRARVLLSALHAIHRFPRVQAGVSSCRLVKGAKESAGPRQGTSGKKSGQASLTWAFSEAAGLFWRNTPAGQTSRARLVKNQGKGPAFTGLAHQLARAVSSLVTRETAFARDNFGHEYRSGARAPAASLAAAGLSLARACWCR